MIDRLSERAKSVVALLPRKKKVTCTQVIEAIGKTDGIGKFLLDSLTNITLPKSRTVDVEKLIKEAYYQSLKLGHPYVGTEHILLGLLKLVVPSELNRVRMELVNLNVFPSAMKSLEKARKTPILDAFSENLNYKTLRNLDRTLVDRKEYDTLVSTLLLKNSSNVLLVGDVGVGKRTLIELLARNIATLDVPPILAGYQVIEFDLVAFLTSVFNKGGLDVGLSSLADELKTVGRVILSIKNFQSVFFATSAGITMPVFYSMFKSVVDATNVRLIATMNSSLYEKILGENDHVIEDFTIIEIKEPNEKTTLKILENSAQYISDYHNINIPSDVIKFVYKKARLGSGESKFPQKGIDLMDFACSHMILNKSKIPRSYKKLVDKRFEIIGSIGDHFEKGNYEQALRARKELKVLDTRLAYSEENLFVTERMTLTTAIVADAIEVFSDGNKGESDKVSISRLSNLTETIQKRIIGQDDAVTTVVRSLIRAKLGLRNQKRPIGNFLFLGPTGVGKTELAKVLADEFFGEKSLIRLDMSDFAEKHTVARLVGAPPGYVGYGEGGELTSKIETRPDSIVLFDEIEKAHPDVLNILLQIMEEGELTDARGNTFDFSRSVIILTSNLGTEILHTRAIGFSDPGVSDKKVDSRLRVNLKKIMKPELLNRFDEIIVFKQLSRESQERILNILIRSSVENLKSQKIKLTISDDAFEYLLKTGYSQEYGARSLRRTVEKHLLDKIAEFLLKHKKRPLSLHADYMRGSIIIIEKTVTKKK
ncbi:AAA domain-containing protein [candidate division WWE3 bacterium]|uniref:AAA domain-containing protein n=1 Tax=candidate division WWE3 bacterium TaxID=2053526 RepID=A0A7X9HGQ8_UNCKA|nr:AAA domain-containing protein [candidate division WWE3 bacterium]